MKTNFNTNAILFQLLNGKTSIKGGCYVEDDRPLDSQDEDIVVNTVDLTQDVLPQIGTSNVNIYVSDTSKNINGKLQVMANRTRLEVLTREVLSIIRNANIQGLKIIPGNILTMYEPLSRQHFVNIRIDWNIQID